MKARKLKNYLNVVFLDMNLRVDFDQSVLQKTSLMQSESFADDVLEKYLMALFLGMTLKVDLDHLMTVSKKTS